MFRQLPSHINAQNKLNFHIQNLDLLNNYCQCGQNVYYLIQKYMYHSPIPNRKVKEFEQLNTWSTVPNHPSNQFRLLQQITTNLFTQAKQELQRIYQQVTNELHQLSTFFLKKNKSTISTLIQCIQQIREEAQQKMMNIHFSIHKAVITKSSFHNLMCEHQRQYNSLSSFKQSMRQIQNHQKSSVSKQKRSQLSVGQVEKLMKNREQVNRICLEKIKIVENTQFLNGHWPVLEEITLQSKKLIQLPTFSQIQAEELIHLNLSHNKISSLDGVKSSYFPSLTSFNLSNNTLKTLDGIQTANFPNLQVLDFSSNFRLQNIQALKEAYFPELLHLNVSNNEIRDVRPLVHTDFPNLQILNLDQNKIDSLDFFCDCTFNKLKILSFSDNQISSIKFIENAHFYKLQGFYGHSNQIHSLESLCKAQLKDLKQISLHGNKIGEYSTIKKMNFPKLIVFDLENNKLQKPRLGCFQTQIRSIKEAKRKFPFILI